MGRNGSNTANLNIPSRVIAKSQNAGYVQQRLGVNFGNVSSVTTEDVKKSNGDLEEAKRQKLRSAKFVQNQKALFKLLEDIARLELELLRAGYDTDKKIEALVQTGMIASAEYQKAIQLLELRGQIGIAKQAVSFQLGAAKLGHKATQEVGLMQHKHQLDITTINAVYAQKKALATQGQNLRIAQGNQKQLNMAAFKAELNSLPGDSQYQNQGALPGYTSNGGGGLFGGGGGGGGGGFWSGFKKMLGFRS